MLPIVKEARVSSDTVNCSSAKVVASPGLEQEKAALLEVLEEHGIRQDASGMPISLRLAGRSATSATAQSKATTATGNLDEAYELSVAQNGITISAKTPAGVFYGTQTLAHLLADSTSVPVCEIRDWPDFPLRMVMVDPARQNENFDYYRRLIRFCAKQKLNAILLHLTDDQTAALFEPNYPELMHPHSWKQEDARALADYARKYHVQLIPEIEACGHSRMFTRREDYARYLHQTTKNRDASDWLGTQKAGYTNVLCPASEPAYEYVERMVAAAEIFDSPVVHLGFDEVDMTTCARCAAKWPDKPAEFWFRQQLERCIQIVQKHGKRPAVWGDMLLKHPDMLTGIDPKGLIIYDWQYHPDVTPETPRFFTQRGFDVVACPSLMCYPHIVLPDELNYNNVRTFAKVARDEKLAGLNTTYWMPARYLSGAMWPTFAYAGAQAWGGSNFDKQLCLGAISAEHFGIRDAAGFTRMWDTLATATLHLREFEAALYVDDQGSSLARSLYKKTGGSEFINQKLQQLDVAQKQLNELSAEVTRNRDDWNALQHSARILAFTLNRFQNVTNARNGATSAEEASQVREILTWINEDWTRNRYPGDPNLDGVYTPGQNLAWHFKQLSGK